MYDCNAWFCIISSIILLFCWEIYKCLRGSFVLLFSGPLLLTCRSKRIRWWLIVSARVMLKASFRVKLQIRLKRSSLGVCINGWVPSCVYEVSSSQVVYSKQPKPGLTQALSSLESIWVSYYRPLNVQIGKWLGIWTGVGLRYFWQLKSSVCTYLLFMIGLPVRSW